MTHEFPPGLGYALKMRGDDVELVDVTGEFLDKAVPSFLRPLQTGGGRIKPCLCHGGLWAGNIQIDVEMKQPVAFDPCLFYGHDKMDLQCMRSPQYAVGLELWIRTKGRSARRRLKRALMIEMVFGTL